MPFWLDELVLLYPASPRPVGLEKTRINIIPTITHPLLSTDSDIGGAGGAVDPNNSRGPVENFRAVLWGSKPFRYNGVMTREEFLNELSNVGDMVLEEVEHDFVLGESS